MSPFVKKILMAIVVAFVTLFIVLTVLYIKNRDTFYPPEENSNPKYADCIQDATEGYSKALKYKCLLLEDEAVYDQGNEICTLDEDSKKPYLDDYNKDLSKCESNHEKYINLNALEKLIYNID